MDYGRLRRIDHDGKDGLRLARINGRGVLLPGFQGSGCNLPHDATLSMFAAMHWLPDLFVNPALSRYSAMVCHVLPAERQRLTSTRTCLLLILDRPVLVVAVRIAAGVKGESIEAIACYGAAVPKAGGSGERIQLHRHVSL
ncbi:hypothetical protein [Arthrobacter mobilis]|uniref:Uncharacterized protein n=1 Tax=Arthrobacter mobilis TaxID=2724944 RepID=A0A7X6K6Y2_9MICC|nr:hypothetical protein [Arthrobacter mobilis]NKX56285.1 hypothetical protein [Arthrobacter mobilis]